MRNVRTCLFLMIARRDTFKKKARLKNAYSRKVTFFGHEICLTLTFYVFRLELISGVPFYQWPNNNDSPLDRYLILGQQVVFWSLELQEVPISTQRLSSCPYQQDNHQKTWAFTRVKLTTELATSSTAF